VDEATRIELETRLSFQEDTLARLNDALIDQQRQLDALRETLTRLTGLLERLPDDRREAPLDERPPHY
jgi:SlyX protein